MSLDITQGANFAYWGVPTITGTVMQSADLDVKPALKPTIKNEQGVVITRGYGDITSGIKVSVVFSGNFPPSVGSLFQFSGYNWICEEYNVKWKNEGFTEAGWNGIRSEGINV